MYNNRISIQIQFIHEETEIAVFLNASVEPSLANFHIYFFLSDNTKKDEKL